MPKLRFSGQECTAEAGETVLAALERCGLTLPSSCRSGVCQSCLVKATAGSIPERAQLGLKPLWKERGYLLACVCPAEDGLVLEEVGASLSCDASVDEVEALGASVVRVRVGCPEGFDFQAGQFLQLERPSDGLMRPYSIASLPETGQLELHVALVEGGAMSQWLKTAKGEAVRLRGPCGECVYLPQNPEQPLVLAGTGTGLAPLLGVLRAALAHGHQGPIQLLHGARDRAGLYLLEELRRLEAEHENLSVEGVTLEPQGADSDVISADLEKLCLERAKAEPSPRVYLCGNPTFVRTLKRKLYLAGRPLSSIHSDPFVQANQ